MRNDLSAEDTAIELLRRGLWPVVLHALGSTIHSKLGDKISTGKEPIVGAWGEAQPTEASLRRLFRQYVGAGVGIALGPKGGVVDIDVDGPEGEASLLRMCGGTMPDTLGWTSRRGRHRLFLWDDRFIDIDPEHRAKIVLPDYPDLEFRFGLGMQAQSACPPTLGEDGVPRRWIDA